MQRAGRLILLAGLVAAVCGTGAATSRSDASVLPAVVRTVPFHGRYLVTATWGLSGGANHDTPAIDFKMPIGTPVYATAAGSVDFVSRDNRNCNPLAHVPVGGTYADAVQWCIAHGMNGTRIRIRHDDGSFSMYVHLSRIRDGIAAQPSSRVAAGQLIAWSGNSGISTGPHLHYSKINSAGTATVDPGTLRACWGTAAHQYANLRVLRGTYVRHDGHRC